MRQDVFIILLQIISIVTLFEIKLSVEPKQTIETYAHYIINITDTLLLAG